jgi:dolichol kinase
MKMNGKPPAHRAQGSGGHERGRTASRPRTARKAVVDMNEDERQILHMLLGLGCIAMAQLLGVELSAYVVSVALVIGLVLVHIKLSFIRLGHWLEWLLERFERPGVLAGYGALTFTAAVLCLLTLLSSQPQILASLSILGIGDAASTIAGRRSKRRLPYNPRKTYGGTLAFFLASAPFALFFAGAPALLVAAIAALAESLESRIDDNLIIAAVCVVGFRLAGG